MLANFSHHSGKGMRKGVRGKEKPNIFAWIIGCYQFYRGNEVADRQIKAVEYIKTKGKITNSEHQEINEIGKSVTIDELRYLVERHILVRIGETGRGSYYELANKNDRNGRQTTAKRPKVVIL